MTKFPHVAAGLAALMIPAMESAAQAQSTPRDVVHGNLIQFTDNGAWSWFQDERAIVDTTHRQILVGSMANQYGVGGSIVDGDVRVTHFDLDTGRRHFEVLGNLESYGGGDDHNVPALLVKEDGNVLAVYAAHNNLNGIEDDRSYHRTFDTSTGSWGPESEYRWWSVIPSNAPGSGGTTYSNVFQLSAEDADGDGNGRIYNFARTQQSPHIMYSGDNGATWHYGGQLTKQASNAPSSSYVNGYYKYASNGVDRIDLIATEFHPRDSNTSIYHAYVQGGRLHDSAGNVIDDDIFDTATSFDASKVVSTDDFTRVFRAGRTENSRAWNSDVRTYADGTINVLFKARDGGYHADHTIGRDEHNVWFARFDPAAGAWNTHEIARSGPNLFGATWETDYTGLGAIDPDDANTIYLSTKVSPLTDAPTDRHEMYRGVTEDNGATWTWTAITENSSYDNLRPIVPEWDAQNTALLWWRGSMSASQQYDAAVVGLLIRDDERVGMIRYVDADTSNTTGADGDSFAPTADADTGAADNDWHIRTGFGNGSDVLSAGEMTTGTVSPLETSVSVLETTVANLDPGLYDVFVFCWSDHRDGRIVAGMRDDDLMVYRRRGAQQAQAAHFDNAVSVEDGDRSLYRAYLGRVELTQGDALDVFIDRPITSDSARVWYDGIGYARVDRIP